MKTTDIHQRRKGTNRYSAVLVTISVSTLITAIVFGQLRAFERRATKEAFLYQADQQGTAWIAAVEDRLNALRSLRVLYNCSDYVSRDEFHRLAETSILRYRGVELVQWVPCVPAESRYEHEQQARRDGIERYRITGRSVGPADESGPRMHRPICYVEPLADNQDILGFDLGSDPHWQTVLDRTAASAQMTVATNMAIPGRSFATQMCVAIEPVYQQSHLALTEAERRAGLQGFIVGVLNLETLGQVVSASDSNRIDVELLDVTASEPRPLYRTPSSDTASGSSHPGASEDAGLVWEKPLDLGAGRWMIRCSAAPDFRGSRSSLAALVIGLFVTCCAAVYVRSHQTRLERVSRLVAEKTHDLQVSEAELKRRNEFLYHILASLAHPLYVLDARDFTVKLSNQPAEDAESATRHSTCCELIADRDRPCDGENHVCPVVRVRETRQPLVIERRRSDGQGGDTYLEVHAYPVLDDHGEVSEVIEYHFDITARQKAQERQAALLEELESINRELKDFAYVVSHDLKAPLRGIHVLAQWIMDDLQDKLGERGKEQMELLMGRVHRMQSLIDGVLAYSRVSRIREEQATIDTNELVAQVVEDLSPPPHIEFDVQDNLPTVFGEPTRIRQLFQNLVSNAVKYMEKERGSIQIGGAEEKDCWQFFVRDNGPGIEAKHFERIFQVFQTLVPKDTNDSTGVGLTVVKKIVERHGGKIWLESEVGQGTTFFFTLSKARSDGQQADSRLSFDAEQDELAGSATG